MIRIACTFILLLVTSHARAADAPDCHLHVIAQLEMQTIPDGRPVIPVKLEGHNYRLMVDTGGYISTLSPQVVREEGYRAMATSPLIGMGTRILYSYVRVKDFSFGNSHGHDLGFYVGDGDNLFYDGTLSPEILTNYDTDMDFGHDKLNLISPDHCPGKVVYWTQGAAAIVPISIQGATHIRVPVTIDGKDVKAIIDTGSHTSFITMSAAKRFLDLDPKDPALVSRGNIPVNGMVGPVFNYPFKTLSFAGVTVNNGWGCEVRRVRLESCWLLWVKMPR